MTGTKAPRSGFETWRRRNLEAVETGLDRALKRLKADGPETGGLGGAMRYALLGGGKRLRPLLALAAAEAVGGTAREALPLALAVELMHAYSLVHDDLPAMDDDDLRRGRPTCHKAFGEGQAILAGDALLTLSFGVLAEASAKKPAAARRFAQAAARLAQASGAAGMAGGQALDLALERTTAPVSAASVRDMERRKTGALMAAALAGGGQLAGGGPAELRRLHRLGLDLGLAFQIKDDLLNLCGNSALTGKAVGSDAVRGKATLPALAGREAAEDELTALTRAALASARTFKERGRRLTDIISALAGRCA